MSNIHLQSIYRYPIKGFPGQALSAINVVPGQGIAFDRFLGFANGSAAISPQTWSPCQGFVRMTRNEGLPRFGIDFDEERLSLHIQTPNGQQISIDLSDPNSIAAADGVLASLFPTIGTEPVRLLRRRDDLGWWDYEDATISLINLETVAALSHKASQVLDPLRFRGNLHITGLPAWSEFALIGRQIRIGSAEFEVLRPIDRCKATSIDPITGVADYNIPALLAAQEGHIFCGVYLRLVQPGRIQAGNRIEEIGPAANPFSAGLANPDAPPVEKWPRPAEVVDCVQTDHATFSLWLRDPAAVAYRQLQTNQHLRLHLAVEDEERAWRAYLITTLEDDRLCITVKAENPVDSFSPLLYERSSSGSQILISGPFRSA